MFKYKIIKIFVVSVFLVLSCHAFCFADMIYLKNGNVFEGIVNGVEDGYWIEGMFFPAKEIDRIEKDVSASLQTDSLIQEEPSYQVIDTKTIDVPGKAQVIAEILVKGNLTEGWLQKLLRSLYDSIKTTTGFKYYVHPTNIYIYVYLSKEHYESGMGQWIAMLSKSQADSQPKINIRENRLSYVKKNPEVKFGFSEDYRKKIWKEVILVEDKSYAEAEMKYPHNVQIQMKFQEELYNRHKKELAKKFQISLKQLKEIVTEGMMKGWAMPAMK